MHRSYSEAGEHMSSKRDKAGRPIVVVTGGGLVTSLGAGKSDNWRRLTAGESGIRTITRFGTEGLRTKVAGTVDFIPLDPYSAPALSERLAELAAEEAIAQSGLGSRGHFPGPLFLAVAPVEVEWPQREVLAEGPGAIGPIMSGSCSARSAKHWQRSSAPPARRSRCRRPVPPAPAPFNSASKQSAAAKPTRRCASLPTARSIPKA